MGILKLEESLYVAQRIYNLTHGLEDDMTTVHESESFDDILSRQKSFDNSRILRLWAKLRSMVLGGFVSRAHELEMRKKKKLEMDQLMKIFFSNWRDVKSFHRIPKSLFFRSTTNDAAAADNNKGIVNHPGNSRSIVLLKDTQQQQQQSTHPTTDADKFHEIIIYNGMVLMNIAAKKKGSTLDDLTTDNAAVAAVAAAPITGTATAGNNNRGGFDVDMSGTTTDELGSCIVETLLGRLISDAAITATTKLKFKDDETMSVMKAELVRYLQIYIYVYVIVVAVVVVVVPLYRLESNDQLCIDTHFLHPKF
jgi:hypothetical protein